MDDEWEQNPGNLPMTATEAGFSPVPHFFPALGPIPVGFTFAHFHVAVAIPRQALWLSHSLAFQTATEQNQQFVLKMQMQKV